MRMIRVKNSAVNTTNKNTLVLKFPSITIRLPPKHWKAVHVSTWNVDVVLPDDTLDNFDSADCKAFIREGK